MTRIQRFRAFIKAMNPSSDPREAIESGLYVEPPNGSVWSALKFKLELEAASSHLVLGGIGSGKSTELLMACSELQKSLAEVGDFVSYCDVSNYHRLDAQSSSGILFSLTAQQIRAEHPPTTAQGKVAADKIRKLQIGSSTWVSEPDDYYEPDDDDREPEDFEPGHWHKTPGVVVSPEPNDPRDWRLAGLVPDLKIMLSSSVGANRTVVMLFDSLDRLPSAATFKTIVEDDMRALKAAGVGIVIVGPIRYMVGNDRGMAEMFDHVHDRITSDPQDATSLAFLCDILERRSGSTGLLPDECLAPLARASGGVLRDLIALAKRSAEEAYATANAIITLEHVQRATEAMGRSLAIGLDDDQVKELRTVHDTGRFVVRGERQLSLLETRRVLMYPGNRWVVHPALAPMLAFMPEVQ